MSNTITTSYKNLSPTDLKKVRAMFFSEFAVSETALNKFINGVSQPKNKYVKFFSILFDLKENLSPIVMDCQLSREYRPFEYKDFSEAKTEAKTKVDAIFTPKPKSEKPKVGLREQARANQAKNREERLAQRKRNAEHDAQYRSY